MEEQPRRLRKPKSRLEDEEHYDRGCSIKTTRKSGPKSNKQSSSGAVLPLRPAATKPAPKTRHSLSILTNL